MSSKKISEFLMLTTPTGLEQTVVSIAGVNHRVTLNAIKALITKADLNLSNVDNTADADKPVSAAVAVALATKSNMGHTHAMADIPGLTQYITDQLAALAATLSGAGHTHQMSEITGLVAELAGKATIADLTSLATVVTNINTALAGKANTSHTHETTDINGLTAFVDGKIVNKSDVGHVHAATEITGLTAFVQALIVNAIASLSITGHTHEITDINNLSAVLAGKAAIADVTTLGTLVTAVQSSLANKSNTGHTHTVSELLNFATEVQSIVTAMNLASTNHTHTSAQITDLSAALSVYMRDTNSFMNAVSGIHDELPHTHNATQINGLTAAVIAQLTQTNLQAVVENIVNAMGLGGIINAVTVGDVQW